MKILKRIPYKLASDTADLQTQTQTLCIKRATKGLHIKYVGGGDGRFLWGS